MKLSIHERLALVLSHAPKFARRLASKRSMSSTDFEALVLPSNELSLRALT